MKCRIFSLVMLAFVVAVSAQTFGQLGTHNFIDDTLVVRYKLGTSGTSAIMGMNSKHQYGPDLALWGTLFFKIKPDSVDSVTVSDCQFRIQEVDFHNGDTVYTAIADTSVDTVTTTGIASDTSWQKRAFTPNPANGYRVVCSGTASCSASMNSTLKVWFHLRKKIGVF